MGDFTKRYHEYVKESDRVVSLVDVKPIDGYALRKHMVDMLNSNYLKLSDDVPEVEFQRACNVLETLLTACLYMGLMSDRVCDSYYAHFRAKKADIENPPFQEEEGGLTEHDFGW